LSKEEEERVSNDDGSEKDEVEDEEDIVGLLESVEDDRGGRSPSAFENVSR
jgi:hypothetical protein